MVLLSNINSGKDISNLPRIYTPLEKYLLGTEFKQQSKREHDDANNDAILEEGNGEQSFFWAGGGLMGISF